MMAFKKATPNPKRLKMLVYGSSGTGKSVTSLHFPSPAVIDLEKGTDYYGGVFNFDVIQTVDISEVMSNINELLQDPGNYKTLVIDPVHKVHKLVVEDYLRRKRLKKGDPNYQLQMPDWGPINNKFQEFVNKLLALDMNIICTAAEKAEYQVQAGSDFPTPVGQKPEGPKDIAYHFDVVMRLAIESGKRIAYVEKDRTNRITDDKFEFTYQALTEYFGIEELEREPVAFVGQKALAEQAGRRVEITLPGGIKKMTAGILAEQVTALKSSVDSGLINGERLIEVVGQDYGRENVYELGEDEANLLIQDIEGGNI